MGKLTPTRFYVSPENEAVAVAYLQQRGYSPMEIQKSEDGLIVLLFAPLPDDQMYGLVQALPVHLSAKIGVVMGDQHPFSRRSERPLTQ